MIILLIKTITFTLLIPGTVAVMVPWLITKSAVIGNDWSILCGVFLMCVGVAIYAWCVWDFVSFGKGTPAPIDAPKHLVVKGLYHYTRNPMYVAVLSFIAGWMFLYTMPLLLVYGASIAIGFQLLVIFFEEPLLQKSFNSEYTEYKASVNRWLPGFFVN
ncbi:MAG: isoprenylcysteine carboxylmethyltransferase family protein [Methylococcales bacterium]|nr:isoprenylcysteine carboxylmethyltransferase family protein [Methylococcales bacterium]